MAKKAKKRKKAPAKRAPKRKAKKAAPPAAAPVKRLTANAYANWRKERKMPGGTRQAVSLAIQEGRIRESVLRVGRRYAIDPDLADREWSDNSDAGAPVYLDEPGATLFPEMDGDESPPRERIPSGQDGETMRLLAEQNRRLTVQLKDLEFRRRSGELVELKPILRAAQTAAATVQAKILAVPSRLSAQLAAEGDAHAVHKALEEELTRALEGVTAMVEVP